jgi:uncharacterized membrane protein YeiB
MSASANTASSHASPHRERVGLLRLFFGLWAAPLGWSGQLVLNYGLASFACYPRYTPHDHAIPGWGGVWWVLLAINLLAVALTGLGAAAAYRSWQATRHENDGHTGHVLETGRGRTRFLSLLGTMTSLGFLAAVLFNTVVLFTVPLC